jgi:hypothetical protein
VARWGDSTEDIRDQAVGSDGPEMVPDAVPEADYQDADA